MVREVRGGKDVAFAIDGPRGPRYVAKPGAVWIAAQTGAAIFPFNLSPEKSWVMKSWDQFHIPKPFARVLVLMGKPLYVKEHASEETWQLSRRPWQRSLEDLLHRSDTFWQREPPRT